MYYKLCMNIHMKEQTILKRRRKPRSVVVGSHTEAGSRNFYGSVICWLQFTFACVILGLSFFGCKASVVIKGHASRSFQVMPHSLALVYHYVCLGTDILVVMFQHPIMLVYQRVIRFQGRGIIYCSLIQNRLII